MILVTGGTGFVGKALIRHLSALGQQVRLLLRPSDQSPTLPFGVPVEVTVSSLMDERGLRAAMKGVDVLFHLASAERLGHRGDLYSVDVLGTENVLRAAKDAGVERVFYLSHANADKSSAYPVMKAKALAENQIIASGVPYTIFKTTILFGKGDQFTTPLARLLLNSPGIFLMPGNGKVMVQPLWIEDLVTCLTACLEDRSTVDQIYRVGGMEFLTFREVLDIIIERLKIRRWGLPVPPPYFRILALLADQLSKKGLPVSLYLMDYLAVDQTCAIDSLPRLFGLMPARFQNHLDYLETLR